MIKYLIASLAAVAISASSAWALAPDQAPSVADFPPPTEKEFVAARARGDALIQAAGVQGLFENVTDTSIVAVRHKRSGMVCLFDVNDRTARILVFPGSVRGEDVGCTSKTSGFLLTLYATRYRPTPTADEIYSVSAESLLAVRPGAVEYDKPLSGWGERLAELPPVKSGYFVFNDVDGSVLGKRGQKLISRLAVAIHDGWVLKQRISGPFDQAETMASHAEGAMDGMLIAATGLKPDENSPRIPKP